MALAGGRSVGGIVRARSGMGAGPCLPRPGPSGPYGEIPQSPGPSPGAPAGHIQSPALFC